MTKSRSPAAQVNTGFQPAQSLFAHYQIPEDKGFISQEFQDFGYRLALALDDLKHKSLYIKLAKTVDRGILEQALAFVSDAQAQSKAKLFMWKMGQLRHPSAEPALAKSPKSSSTAGSPHSQS